MIKCHHEQQQQQQQQIPPEHTLDQQQAAREPTLPTTYQPCKNNRHPSPTAVLQYIIQLNAKYPILPAEEALTFNYSQKITESRKSFFGRD